MTKTDDNNDVEIRQIWSLLEEVKDPEVPVLTVVDLGIIRNVRADGEGLEIVLTPTYSGCPAMDVIRMNIRMVLLEHGYKNVKLTTVLAPAWTTDWMSEGGREKLKAYGIAPRICSGGKKLSSVRIVIPIILLGSVSSEVRPVRRFTVVKTVRSLLIILSVTEYFCIFGVWGPSYSKSAIRSLLSR